MKQFGTERKAIQEGLGKIKDVPSVVYGKVAFDTETRRVANPFVSRIEVQNGKWAAYQGGKATPVTLGPWFDYTINGLVVGNIYALLAVGLALIFGVSHLINFAHGSVYMVGAYIGWLCITYLGTPLPVTLAGRRRGLRRCSGSAIERIGLRPLQDSPRIAPLLATIGIGLVLDQVVQLLFTPDPRGCRCKCPPGASRSAAAPSGRSIC